MHRRCSSWDVRILTASSIRIEKQTYCFVMRFQMGAKDRLRMKARSFWQCHRHPGWLLQRCAGIVPSGQCSRPYAWKTHLRLRRTATNTSTLANTCTDARKYALQQRRFWSLPMLSASAMMHCASAPRSQDAQMLVRDGHVMTTWVPH